eukprot:TRINITY_DN4074_c0_g1_i1.p1 TRINITY_DN4074_c0_g1~~TRINITY_DN4074_c0_g1_i1.p1  ORF type:complete len:216 (+),score=34.98 TRINITY_DN4074_c0_g1_i1:225-872(+)
MGNIFRKIPYPWYEIDMSSFTPFEDNPPQRNFSLLIQDNAQNRKTPYQVYWTALDGGTKNMGHSMIIFESDNLILFSDLVPVSWPENLACFVRCGVSNVTIDNMREVDAVTVTYLGKVEAETIQSAEDFIGQMHIAFNQMVEESGTDHWNSRINCRAFVRKVSEHFLGDGSIVTSRLDSNQILWDYALLPLFVQKQIYFGTARDTIQQLLDKANK